ncbi:uncharacterized protein LOC110876537 [Helianthus annuus]|uniref:uncharacterized protein LOC110876537 n=1 Tax=Helianthus annuus TaxID=4232 RepID=UPI000B8F5AF6|nr:uncharacterized protein LOC110876537 [Helianthus annuus]
MYGDRTPMRILQQMLHEGRYVYHTRVNPETNAVEEVFFVHRYSYDMWRAFPHVLMINTTYKTNEYRLPFVQIVGVTSTHKSFCVAHAFISKEKQDNFLWVLQNLKGLLEEGMEPCVIVTDCDKALMNACDKVFPKASKLLCRWHISQNILKHTKAKFATAEEWKIFKLSWSRLCNSPTERLYNYNFERLFTRLTDDHRSGVLNYLYTVWLLPYKEKFVSAWTNTSPNFGQHTTNRVESQHAKFKRYLKGPNSSLHRLVWLVDKVVESQRIQINLTFQDSRSLKMGDHMISFFDNLRGNVSLKALDLLLVEKKKIRTLLAVGGTCGHVLFTSCGLPCACQMEWWENTNCKIPLAAVDKFWTKLDFNAEELKEGDNNLREEMDRVMQQLKAQPPIVLKSMLSKIKKVVNPSMTDHQSPEVQQDTRGRPTSKAQQKKKEEVARRKDTRSEAKGKSQKKDEDAQKPAVQRSRSKKNKAKKTVEIIDEDFPLLVGDRYKNMIDRFKDWLPSMYRRYITHMEDAQPDGNCGFRSVAMGLGLDQNAWMWVRQELLDEMFINKARWLPLLDSFDPGFYTTVYRSINWLHVEPAPMACWMSLPYAGLLVVQKFGVLVQHLSNGVCQTYFPMFDGPAEGHSVLSIAYVEDGHFIMVKLTDDGLMPPPNGLWNMYRSTEAMEWETMYMSRLSEGKELLRSNRSVRRDFINLL